MGLSDLAGVRDPISGLVLGPDRVLDLFVGGKQVVKDGELAVLVFLMLINRCQSALNAYGNTLKISFYFVFLATTT